MMFKLDFVVVVGNIFLIKFCVVFEVMGCMILGKVEFMNFG